ncbi:MAG: four helix bundle protein [Flavobacteriales bacterium]|nr:four helix bundle protein [Flavobacteriales bacterium]
MANYTSYQQMEIYILAREIANDVWNLIKETSLGSDCELSHQINRSSGSIMDNIAEGFGRGGNKEFIVFLGYARGSCCETEAQLQRAADRKHISIDEHRQLSEKTQGCIDQISKFINYLKTSKKKGFKFD